MARNFSIQINGTDRTFFLDLIGDFDGSSAFELLNLLQEKLITRHHKAFINTSRLKSIHPFGSDVFKRNFNNLSHCMNIFFTGAHAAEIAPGEEMRLRLRNKNLKGNLSFLEPFNTSLYVSAGRK